MAINSNLIVKAYIIFDEQKNLNEKLDNVSNSCCKTFPDLNFTKFDWNTLILVIVRSYVEVKE
jgi:hypothetical protein